MQAAINAKLVSSLQPKPKPYEVRDTRLKGFLLRVQPSGAMSYVCEYGRGKRITLGRADLLAPNVAREKARMVLADVVHGKDPRTARRQARAKTLGEFLQNEYGPWVLAHRKTGEAILARLRSCFGDFHDRKLAEINAWVVEKWRSTRLKAGRKPATVNRDITALKAALNKAVEWGLLGESPLHSVKPIKTDDLARVRYLSPDEETALRAALDRREERLRADRASANAWRERRNYDLLPDLRTGFADHLKPMVLLSVNTGLRWGELSQLHRQDVNLARRTISIRGTTAKAGKTRHIPLNDEALAVLHSWLELAADSDYVFPNPDGRPFDNVRKSWQAVLEDAGIQDFRWHDLRHHFASKLVMAGVDLNTVRELLGHSDIQMTLRYAHLAPEHKAEAVSRLLEPSNG